jgi:DNA-directed RNA polymerase subunit L
MTDQIQNIKESNHGFRLECEFKDLPIPFVNGLRRILLTEIPTVVVRNVQILENSTQMIHEMLRHRVDMLPINVRSENTDVIRDTSIELKRHAVELTQITTDDFVVTGPMKNVLLKDRDEGAPIFFMNLKAGESIHIRATIGIDMKGSSQVCVSTFKNHIDPVIADRNRENYVMNGGGDVRVFDNHEIQRSFSVDDHGRPNWFDFAVESIGVTPAKDLLKKAITIYRDKIVEWCKNPILREDAGWFSIETDTEGHTIGALAQAMMYASGRVDYVSYRIEHPLLPKMIVRFNTKLQPEAILDRFKTEAVDLCESILKSV